MRTVKFDGSDQAASILDEILTLLAFEIWGFIQMSYRSLFSIVAVGSLAACATTDLGWTGSGAEPFDTAIANCESEVSGISSEPEREAALEECMAKRGWTRS